MEMLDGFAGAEHLELRRRYRDAHRECGRAGRRAGGAARARRLARARPRPLPLRARPRSRRWPPTPPRRPSWRPSASGCATPRGCARRPPGPTLGIAGADEDGGGGDERRSRRPRRCCRAPAGVDSELDALAERLGALAVELGDVAASCATTSTGSRPTPARLAAVEERLDALDRLERKHGGSVESVLAHAERCREPRSTAWRAPRSAGPRRRRPWPEPERRREELGERLGRRPRQAAAGPLEKRVAAELERLAMPGATPRGRAGAAPRRLRRRRARDGRAAGRAQPRDRAGAAARRRLGRRALAGDAGAERPRRGGRRRDAGLRRDRRRDRRQHRAGRRRAAAGAGRGTPGRLHHPPAAGRLAGRDPLPAREGHRR